MYGLSTRYEDGQTDGSVRRWGYDDWNMTWNKFENKN